MDKKAGGARELIKQMSKLMFTGPGKYVSAPLALGAAGGLGTYSGSKGSLPEHLQPQQAKYNSRKAGWTVGSGLAGAGIGAGIGSALGGTKAGLVAGLLGAGLGTAFGSSHAGRRERERLDDDAILRAQQRFYPIKF